LGIVQDVEILHLHVIARAGNNKVKHHRAEHFKQANLKNVLSGTANQKYVMYF